MKINYKCRERKYIVLLSIGFTYTSTFSRAAHGYPGGNTYGKLPGENLVYELKEEVATGITKIVRYEEPYFIGIDINTEGAATYNPNGKYWRWATIEEIKKYKEKNYEDKLSG